jgi:hypothetical protein
MSGGLSPEEESKWNRSDPDPFIITIENEENDGAGRKNIEKSHGSDDHYADTEGFRLFRNGASRPMNLDMLSMLSDKMNSENTGKADGSSKPVTFSFYTPAQMTGNDEHFYESIDRFKVKYGGFLIVWILTALYSFAKGALLFFNELAAKVTMDHGREFSGMTTGFELQRPTIKTDDGGTREIVFTHAEITISTFTYTIRWGNPIERFDDKLFSSVKYNSFDVLMKPNDIKIMQKHLENLHGRRVNFNYFGSLTNFVLPRRFLDIFCGKNRGFRFHDRKFCSEMIAESMQQSSMFGEYFEKYELYPEMMSPMRLRGLLIAFSAEHPALVTLNTMKSVLKPKIVRIQTSPAANITATTTTTTVTR